MDLCYNRRKLQENMNALEGRINFVNKLYSSAETKFGVDSLREYLLSQTKQGKWQYPKGISYICSELDMIQEKFRSIVFQRFYKEFPYILQIRITEFQVRSDKIIISACLYCLKKVHKGMVIGRGGSIASLIQDFVQKEMIIYLGKNVEVNLDVSDGLSYNHQVTKSTREGVEKIEQEQMKTLKSQESVDLRNFHN